VSLVERLPAPSKLGLVAALGSGALLGGAYYFQYVVGLAPCTMCHWQRWPHYAAIALAALAFLVPEKPAGRVLVGLAVAAILASGLIGIFHAGVEYHFWQGITRCSAPVTGQSSADIMAQIMATPMIQCDVPQWTLFGISLAGFNAIFSILGAIGIVALWRRRP